jgi:hypothetical protein
MDEERAIPLAFSKDGRDFFLLTVLNNKYFQTRAEKSSETK